MFRLTSEPLSPCFINLVPCFILCHSWIKTIGNGKQESETKNKTEQTAALGFTVEISQYNNFINAFSSPT